MKTAISSGRYAHFCFKGFVLCQWCQIDDSKTSKIFLFFQFSGNKGGRTCPEGLPPGLHFHFDRQKSGFGQHFAPESSYGRVQGRNEYCFDGQISLAGSAWWILDVMAVGLRQPTNRQQTTNNNQPTTHPKADTGATTNNHQPTNQSTTDNQ